MRYLSTTEYNTLLAAIRCYQGVLETDRQMGPTLFQYNRHTQEWINDLQEIATDAAPDQTGNLDKDYLEMLAQRLETLLAPEHTLPRQAEPDHVRLKRERMNRVVFDHIFPGAPVLICSMNNDYVYLPATVLWIKREDTPAIKVQYLTVTDGEAIGIHRDDEGNYTSVFERDLRSIAYIGISHPKPELESWAILNVESGRFLNEAENGAIPALSYDQLEEQMLELSEKLTPVTLSDPEYISAT